jgi:hypothetical protein
MVPWSHGPGQLHQAMCLSRVMHGAQLCEVRIFGDQPLQARQELLAIQALLQGQHLARLGGSKWSADPTKGC